MSGELVAGVFGTVELSSEIVESPDNFRTRSQSLISNNVNTAPQRHEYYSSTDVEVVCHLQTFQTAAQNLCHTTAINFLEGLGCTSHFNPFRMQNAHSGFASEHFFLAFL